jgi:hypothetical protein
MQGKDERRLHKIEAKDVDLVQDGWRRQVPLGETGAEVNLGVSSGVI